MPDPSRWFLLLLVLLLVLSHLDYLVCLRTQQQSSLPGLGMFEIPQSLCKYVFNSWIIVNKSTQVVTVQGVFYRISEIWGERQTLEATVYGIFNLEGMMIVAWICISVISIG